jgi:mRNA interferase YafQ
MHISRHKFRYVQYCAHRLSVNGQHRTALDELLREAIPQLAADQPLPDRLRDHALTGDWKDHRDSHIKPDLALIYHKPDDATLRLVRLGSHSELGL